MSSLIPTQQKEVSFFDDAKVTAVLIDGEVYASIRHMCQALTLNTQAQQRRIERSDVLSDGQRVATVATHRRGNQNMNVLRADLVPMWLVGVDTRRMDSEKKQRLINFQKQAAKVLWNAFKRGELTAEFDVDALAEAGNASAQAYVMARAIMSLSYQQLALEQQQKLHASQLADHETRLETLENTLTSPQRVISESQASQLSQAVKNVAMTLSRQTRRNEYGGVFGELYRRYDVTSYKSLPASQFMDAISWLREWLHQIESESF